jgi:hypothetical protein
MPRRLSLHIPLWYPLTSSSPTPSTYSAMKTPDPLSPGPSAFLVETERPPKT